MLSKKFGSQKTENKSIEEDSLPLGSRGLEKCFLFVHQQEFLLKVCLCVIKGIRRIRKEMLQDN